MARSYRRVAGVGFCCSGGTRNLHWQEGDALLSFCLSFPFFIRFPFFPSFYLFLPYLSLFFLSFSCLPLSPLELELIESS